MTKEELMICPASVETVCKGCEHFEPHKKVEMCSRPGCISGGEFVKCVPYVPNARKVSGRKTGKPTTKKSGRLPNGDENERSFLKSTLCAAVAEIAEIKVKHPIILPLKYMDTQNTSTFPIHTLTVTSVITGNITEDSSVLFATKLGQSQKVNDAIIVLMQTIENELSSKKNTGTGNETPTTGTSTKKRNSGKKIMR